MIYEWGLWLIMVNWDSSLFSSKVRTKDSKFERRLSKNFLNNPFFCYIFSMIFELIYQTNDSNVNSFNSLCIFHWQTFKHSSKNMQSIILYLVQDLIGGFQYIPCFLSGIWSCYSSEYAFMHGLVYVEHRLSIFLPFFPRGILLILREIIICLLILWFCTSILDYSPDIFTSEQILHS